MQLHDDVAKIARCITRRESLRKSFTQYSRLLTVPFALLQGYGLRFASRQGALGALILSVCFERVDRHRRPVFLMCLANLFLNLESARCIAYTSQVLLQVSHGNITAIATTTRSGHPDVCRFPRWAIIIVAGVIVMTEAERPVPITYAKRVRGGKMYGGVSTYLPLRVNQAGVIPIIFALSILLFPQLIGGFLAGLSNPMLQSIGEHLKIWSSGGWIYSIFYFLLVFFFTYFYTAVTFDPDAIATNHQK